MVKIRSKPASQEYKDNWDRIFGPKPRRAGTPCDCEPDCPFNKPEDKNSDGTGTADTSSTAGAYAVRSVPWTAPYWVHPDEPEGTVDDPPGAGPADEAGTGASGVQR